MRPFRRLVYTLVLGSAILPDVAGADCSRDLASGCSMPETYTHVTTVSSGALLVTLATDNDAYLIGTPVHVWLSFQNTGSVPLTIPNPAGIDPMDVTVIVPISCNSILQEGCDTAVVNQCPNVFFFFGGPRTLSPGQCFSTERIWDGQPEPHTSPVTPGLYNLFGGMIGQYDFHTPPGGVKLAIQIQASSAVPVTPTTWGLVKSKYE